MLGRRKDRNRRGRKIWRVYLLVVGVGDISRGILMFGELNIVVILKIIIVFSLVHINEEMLEGIQVGLFWYSTFEGHWQRL